MNNSEIIEAEISASIKTKLAVQETLIGPINSVSKLFNDTLAAGNKILCCGNGGSASDAEHFAAELVGRYINHRKSLPSISLTTNTSAITAIANDYGYDQVFSRQIDGLASTGDVLMVITTSGNSENLMSAVQTARAKGLHIVALTGKGGGRLQEVLTDKDIHVCVPSEDTPRIQESHIMILHCWCALIDNEL